MAVTIGGNSVRLFMCIGEVSTCDLPLYKWRVMSFLRLNYVRPVATGRGLVRYVYATASER